jgi:mandelate racemase
MQHALDVNASDYLMPDVMKIGGVSGWMRAAALAHAANKRTSSHLWPEISAQLLAVTPTAHWLEYADWWNAVIAEPLVITDGQASFDGVIGSGVAWNEKAVERYIA